MSRGDTKVFLGNLPPECRVRDIEGFFESHGRVRNVLIKQGKYGFAEFEDSREAEDAVCDLHGKKLLGSRVTVEFAKVGHTKYNTNEMDWDWRHVIIQNFTFRVQRKVIGELPGCLSMEPRQEQSSASKCST